MNDDNDEQCGGPNEGCMRPGCDECGGWDGRGEGREGGEMRSPKAYQVVLDENRTVTGREYGADKDGVLFSIVNGACVTHLALTHEAIDAMRGIAVKIKKTSKQKGGAE